MNRCDCPQPPGGRANCQDDQVAVCVVENGQAVTYCVDPPSLFTRQDRHAKYWGDLIRKCTAGLRPRRGIEPELDDFKLLLTGAFSSGGIESKFELPPDIRAAVKRIIDDWSRNPFGQNNPSAQSSPGNPLSL
jgi:hypothetical protein